MTERPHIAFFGHNPLDAAVRRRAFAFQQAGMQVTGFMPFRGEKAETDFENVDLGRSEDNAYLKRLSLVYSASARAIAARDILETSDLIYARNLDMLAIAQRSRSRLGLTAPLVYECLDVHHKLVGDGTVARSLRWFEERLLRSCALVVVSSPRFFTEHFARHYPGLVDQFLVENRLIAGDAFPARPAAPRAFDLSKPLRLGWFGNLRCRRTLDLMKMLARTFPERLNIVLRGYAATGVFKDFKAEIADYANIEFHGRYRAPDDLETIYNDIDVVWAGDWYEAGANSVWLLPNRIYEGGYFATPAIAPDGTETGAWLKRNKAGLCVAEPVDQTLTDLVGRLIDDRSQLAEINNQLLCCPTGLFVETSETMRALVDAATGSATPAFSLTS